MNATVYRWTVSYAYTGVGAPTFEMSQLSDVLNDLDHQGWEIWSIVTTDSAHALVVARKPRHPTNS